MRKALAWAFVVLNALDVATTLYGIFNTGTREVNPVMRWLIAMGPWTFAATKLTLGSVTAWWCYRRGATTRVFALLCILYALVVVTNYLGIMVHLKYGIR